MEQFRYPVGIQSFTQIRKYGYLYVDKTAQIYDLTHHVKYHFLSRPRRFGKSLLISTIEAYFKGQRELFEGLAIAKLEKEWLEYPVMHLDLTGANYHEPGALENKLHITLKQWEAIYGADPDEIALGVIKPPITPAVVPVIFPKTACSYPVLLRCSVNLWLAN